jgi:hypothetical protein
VTKVAPIQLRQGAVVFLHLAPCGQQGPHEKGAAPLTSKHFPDLRRILVPNHSSLVAFALVAFGLALTRGRNMIYHPKIIAHSCDWADRFELPAGDYSKKQS